MTTFLMLGKYTRGTEGISSARTEDARMLVERLGGKLEEIHALLGEYDIALLLELPGPEAAVSASIGLSRLTGMALSTCVAIPVEDFDRIVDVR